MTKNDPAALKAEADSIMTLLRHGRTMTAQEIPIDLSGLESRVEDLCRAIATLVPNERAGFSGTLVSMLDELGALESDMRAQHGKISGEMDDLGRRRKAVQAYTPTAPKPDDKT